MITYTEGGSSCCSILVRWRGSVIPKSVLCALPSSIVAIILCYLEDRDSKGNFREDSGLDDMSQSFMWNAITVVIAGLLAFRTRQALGRFWEGTSLLHQMRGEWFDAASCLMTFSRDARVTKGKGAEVMEFRHTLLRLMSLMHASALDEIGEVSEEGYYEVLDIQGLDDETLKFLRNCKASGFNRVEALQHMIQVLVTHNHHSGVITIPPPILSRIYQTLSRGLVNLLNAKKIKDTSFPFPYAQIIMVLLILQSLFTPVIFTQHIDSMVFAAICSFLPIFGMFCLNFIAIELEMPFGTDDNDLPLAHFQEEMNATLLMLIHDMADHLPHTSPKALLEFRKLELFVKEAGVQNKSNSTSFMTSGFFDSSPDKGLDDPVPFKNSTTHLLDEFCEKRIRPQEAPPKLTEEPKQAATETKAAEPIKEPIKLRSPPEESAEHASQIPPSQDWLPWLIHQSPWIAINPRSTPDGTKLGITNVSSAPEQSQTILPKLVYDLDRMYDNWSRKTDLQVQEIQKNTETIDSFAKAFPTMLNKHMEASSSLTQAVLRTLESPNPEPSRIPANEIECAQDLKHEKRSV